MTLATTRSPLGRVWGLPVIRSAFSFSSWISTTGKPATLPKGDRVVANVIGREGNLQDTIFNVPVKG